tara:strand:- start:426 stop:1145 length:720 start_codon:yes stop_codon:yes gene_type:complete
MKKIVLITGATGGIGSAICENLQEKFRIVAIGRDKNKLDKLNRSVKNLEKIVCDLSNKIEIENLVKKVLDDYGRIDILINNAGITDDSLFLRMTPEKWESVINTNLTSNFLLTNLVSKSMIKNKWGRIVNITSVVGHTGNIGQSNYCASKAGVVAMSKSIAIELAKRNVTVNCISPGFIKTKMTEILTDEQKNKILEKIPLGEIGLPEDIAHCVGFLVSEHSRYITGETIHINGGLAML